MTDLESALDGLIDAVNYCDDHGHDELAERIGACYQDLGDVADWHMENDAPEFGSLYINSWTQPMHLFVGQDIETALCGIGVKEANNQHGEPEFDPETDPESGIFPASDKYEDMDDLRYHFAGDTDGTCSACLDVLTEAADD